VPLAIIRGSNEFEDFIICHNIISIKSGWGEGRSKVIARPLADYFVVGRRVSITNFQGSGGETFDLKIQSGSRQSIQKGEGHSTPEEEEVR
jgi:hypothetical protein